MSYEWRSRLAAFKRGWDATQPIAHRAIRRPPRFVVARSAKRICGHIWNRICGIAAMLTFRTLEHKSLGAPNERQIAQLLLPLRGCCGIMRT